MNTEIIAMPELARFNGITIHSIKRLGKHRAPYFKVQFGGNWASVLLDNFTTLKNDGIPKSKMKEAVEWAKANSELLANDWARIHGTPKSVKSSTTHVLTDVKATDDFLLYCVWPGGEIKVIDFNDYKSELVGLASPLNAVEYFLKVKLIKGLPTWPNGLDFDPDELYDLGTAVDKKDYAAAKLVAEN